MTSERRRVASRLPRPNALLALAAVVLMAVAGAGWWLSAPRPPDGPPDDSPASDSADPAPPVWHPPSEEGYVGTVRCATCHPRIAEAYATHPMSRSLRHVDLESAAARVPREETRVVGQQRVHEVEIRDGLMLHHELMFDAAGKVIYDQAVPMKYEVGSGRRARAYLWQHNDLLFMSPLNWYRQAGQWDLAPGYVADDPRRFERRVLDDCLGCHAGRVASLGRSLNRYADPPFHEMSIGCENCHGPGEEHVLLHETGSLGAGQTDPIVNPARLDHDRRESVCYQCHLQAAVRLPRYGRSHFDFRPGDRLEDVWTVLDSGSGVTEDGRTKFVSQVQQMRASRCYTESNGGLGCTSCHDPHRVPTRLERVDFYRTRCLTCHGENACTLPPETRHEQDNSCIACHMPALDASNIAHVSQTDHRVIRTIASEAEAPSPRDELAFFDRADLKLTAWERERMLGLGAWVHLSKQGHQPPEALAQLLIHVLDEVPDDGTVLTVLGSMALDRQLAGQARDYYERALDDPASEEAALFGLLKIHYLSAGWQNALVYADRLLAIDPRDARVHAMRADALAAAGRPAEGIAAARRALECNPTLIPVREWLVRALGEAGRVEEQREQEAILRRMYLLP